MPRIRLRALLLLTVLLLTVLAAGCTSGPVKDVPDDGVVTIRVLTGTDTSINAGDRPLGGATGIYAQLVNWWNRNELESTNIKIELATVRGGATTAHSQMVSEAQAGAGDVFNLDSQWLPEFVRGGYLRPLHDLVEQRKIAASDFLAKPWASALDSRHRLYSVPFTTDAGLLYYREGQDGRGRRLVRADQVGYRQTLGDLVDLGRDVVRLSPDAITTGYVGQFGRYEGMTVNALEAIWSQAPRTFTGRRPADDPDQTKIMQALIDLRKAYAQLPPPTVTSATQGGYDEGKAAGDFAGGKVALMRNWPIYYARILAGGPGTIKKEEFRVSLLPYPSVLGGQNLAISRKTPHPDAAIEVVRFLTSKETQRCLFAVGGFPATRSDAYDEAWPGGTLPGGDPSAPELRCGTAKGNWTDIGPLIREAVGRAQSRPATPYYSEFSDLLSSRVQEMLRSPHDPSEATVAKLVRDLRTIYGDHVPRS